MKIKIILLCFVQFSTLFLSAQTSLPEGIRTVLCVPFERFEFHTEIQLKTINKANNMSSDEYYPALISTFNESFILNSSNEVQYKIIEPADFKELMKYAEHEMVKSHYSCNMDELKFSQYAELMKKYECDYMLTVNWYRIMRVKRSIKIDKSKKYQVYGYFAIDYDLFDRNKLIKLEKSMVKYEVTISAENYLYNGVRLSDLIPVYKLMVDEITLNISNVNN